MGVRHFNTSIRKLNQKKKEVHVLKKMLMDTELALTEEYEKRLILEETMKQIQLAMTEMYESQG